MAAVGEKWGKVREVKRFGRKGSRLDVDDVEVGGRIRWNTNRSETKCRDLYKEVLSIVPTELEPYSISSAGDDIKKQGMEIPQPSVIPTMRKPRSLVWSE